MTLFSRKKADRSLAEETALVPADDENSRQQDADKHMISGKKKCQEDSDSDEKYGKSKLSLHVDHSIVHPAGGFLYNKTEQKAFALYSVSIIESYHHLIVPAH